MPNETRAQKWLDIVDEDLSVAEDLYKISRLGIKNSRMP